jgi:lipooligosaccharide transport system permease protein
VTATEGRLLPGPWRRITAVWWRHVRVWCNYLIANSFPPFLEPLIFILAVGVGLAVFIPEMGGVPYLVFLAPGQIMTSVCYAAIFETTFGTYIRLVIDKNYDAMLATPVTASEIFWGELLYTGSKGAFFAGTVMLVLALFGIIWSPWALLAIPVGFFTGVSFGALGLLVTCVVHSINNFSFFLTGFVTPVILFSATLFPLESLPKGMQTAAKILPLYYPVHLTRMFTTGRFQPDLLFALAYTVLVPLLLGAVAVFLIRRRLVQ